MKLQLAELSRRGVFNSLIAYAVACWVLIEVTSVIAPAFLLPDWIVAALATLLVLGAFPVLLLSWRYEITREGIKRDTRSVPDDMQRSARSVSVVIGVILLAVTTALWVNYFRSQSSNELETILQAQQGAPEISEDGLIRSIAVLPFEDYSPDGGRRLLADGIAEAVLHVLAQNKGLLVTARTSSFYFRDKDVTAAEIGRLLNVEALLEGSVQIAKGRLRVTSQLIRTSDQSHIWSNVYEAPLDDLFEVQDAIAYEVRDLILPKKGSSPGINGQPHPPSVEAYQLLLEARELIGDQESTQRAIRMISVIINLWPDYADAYAWLAMAWDDFAKHLRDGHSSSYSDIKDAIDQGRRATETALELNPDNHLALLIKGKSSAELTSRDYHEAILMVLELAPNDPPVLKWLAGLMFYSAEYEMAREYLGRARAVDPSDYGILEYYLYSSCGLEPGIPLVETHLQDYPTSQIKALSLRWLAQYCDDQFVDSITTSLKLARLDSKPDAALNSLMLLAALGHQEALALIGAAHKLMPRQFKDAFMPSSAYPSYFTEILDERLATYHGHMKSIFGRPNIPYAITLIMAGDYAGAAASLDGVKSHWDSFYQPEGGQFWQSQTMTIYTYWAWLLATHGETAEAQALAEELLQALEGKKLEKWSGSLAYLDDIPLQILILNGKQEQAVDWLLDAEQDRWLFFQPVLTSPIYAEFRKIPKVAEALERMVAWRAAILDELVASGLPEVQDPSLLLTYMESLITLTHHELAQMALHFDDEPAAALRHYERALGKEPDNPVIIEQMAELAAEFGLVDESITLGERAVALAPMDASAHYVLGWSYASAQRWDAAVTSIRRALELDPESPSTKRLLGMILILKGEPRAAMDAIQQIPDGYNRSMALVLAYYALGQQPESDAALLEWKEQGAEMSALHVAYVYAYRDEADLAFEWLYKAGSMGRGVSTATSHPFLLKLHDDPRWLPFLESIGKSPEQLAGFELNLTLPDSD